MLHLRKRSALASSAVRQAILDLSEGITVRIVRLIEAQAAEAIHSSKEKIDSESFATAPLHAPLLSMTEKPAPAE